MDVCATSFKVRTRIGIGDHDVVKSFLQGLARDWQMIARDLNNPTPISRVVSFSSAFVLRSFH